MKDKSPLEGAEFEAGSSSVVDNEEDAKPEDINWLDITRAAYRSSTDFMDANHRTQIERNISNFQSRHPKGSKYHSNAYKYRSRLFRPKTRIAVRKNEAAFAAAMFSADDVVNLQAEDDDDPVKRRDAAYWNEVLNYRLTKTIPWFKVAVGAFQEANVCGIVVSKQYWDYEEGVKEEELADHEGIPLLDEYGEPIVVPVTQPIKDRPWLRLIPFENIRIDPACDWLDPINSTPVLQELVPMYVDDVLQRMENEDENGEPEWYPLTKGQIIAYGKDIDKKEDPTRRAREKGRETEADQEVNNFETVWPIENFVRYMGEEYVYWTLGTEFMLTDPVPLEEDYKHGIRPYTHGICVIEPHRHIPTAPVELYQELQAETNDIANQRRDNIKLALNKRKYVNRNNGTDLNALTRSVPGGTVLTDDINSIREEDTSDVTGSSYQEQNRLDADFDDIAGVMSSSSVMSNRQLNETVGGMEMMSAFANKESEYMIRTFVETWVEPTIGQLVLLEQNYEEDEHIKDLAMKNVEKAEKKAMEDGQEMGEAEVPDAAAPMETPMSEPQNVDVSVNVGFGNLNPEQRIASFMQGIQTLATVAPWTAAKLNVETVATEIFSAYGHKNGAQYYTDFKPPEPQQDPETEIAMAELKLERDKLNEKAQHNDDTLAIQYELGMAKIAATQGLTMEQLYANLDIKEREIQAKKEIAGASELTKLAKIEREKEELEFKATTGRDGI